MPSSDKLSALCELVQHQQALLEAEFSDQAALGGVVLLGKHYAAAPGGIVMLGLNPGVGRSQHPGIDCHPQERNWLLEGMDGEKVRYWTNAMHLFRSFPEVRAAMETATFSFCCPFRSKNWGGMAKAQRDEMIRLSQPILRQIMVDCAPSKVIVAGKKARDLLMSMLRDDLTPGNAHPGGCDARGTYSWAARDATFRGSPFTLIRVPHLSRAGSKGRLTACGAWLRESLS